MELLARAQALEAAGRDIIHMEVGEPDFPSPPAVIEAGRTFLKYGDVRYTPASGLPALREEISAHYRERFGADVRPERILVTAGASGALLLALAALTEPGDEWLLTDPGYPCNRQFVQAFEGIPRMMPVGPESAYQPQERHVRQAWSARARGLIVASPANPTGTLLAPADLDALASLMQQLDGTLIVDEIYQGLCFDGESSTVLSYRDDVFVVNSFSKYFGMTGWRLGWLVVPEGLSRRVEMLAQHLYIAPSTPAQHAALAAFTPDSIALLEERRRIFGRRRDVLLGGLKEIGFEIACRPGGAFYIYAGTRQLCADSMELAHQLLDKAGVATTPGADFGEWHAAGHLRLAYTTDEARLLEALERIRRCVRLEMP